MVYTYDNKKYNIGDIIQHVGNEYKITRIYTDKIREGRKVFYKYGLELIN